MATRTSFEFESNVDSVIEKMGDEAEDRVRKATHHLRNEVQETLSGPRSGETYKVPDTRNTYYTASAPGEPPAQRLGHLRSSIGWKITKERGLLRQNMKIIGKVGTPLDYGAKLETGEYPSGRNYVVRRPWLGPTMVRERQAIKRILGGSRWL